MKCSACGQEGLVRRVSREGFLEKYILSLCGIKPFECRLCRSRFLRFSKNSSSAEPEQGRRRRRNRSEAPSAGRFDDAVSVEKRRKESEAFLNQLRTDEVQSEKEPEGNNAVEI